MKIKLFRDGLDVLESSKDRFVVEEKPHKVAGTAFILLAIMIMAQAIQPRNDKVGSLVVALIAVGILTLGVCALVRSTISLDRQSGILRVRRRLLGIDLEKQYGVQNVKQGFERKTLKGHGLRLELKDGRRRNLTLWTEYLSLSEEVAAFNHLIRRSRKYVVANRQQP